MQFILDYLGASMFVGAFLLTAMTFQSDIMEVMADLNAETIQQDNMYQILSVMDYDFLKMGYNKTNPKLVPGALDSTSVFFFADIDNDSNVDSVRYFLSDTSALSVTPNPNDCIVYRQVNTGSPQTVITGVTRFRVSYFDGSLTQIAYADLANVSNVNTIRLLRIELTLENGIEIGGTYAGVAVEKTYAPEGLRN